jgi:hypothetical protein
MQGMCCSTLLACLDWNSVAPEVYAAAGEPEVALPHAYLTATTITLTPDVQHKGNSAAGGQLALCMCVVTCLLCCSISVTAERWVPLLEVKEAALLGWLRQQKAAG